MSKIIIDGWIQFKPEITQEGSLEVKDKNGLTKILLPDGNEQRQFFKVENKKVTSRFEIAYVGYFKRLLNKIRIKLNARKT